MPNASFIDDFTTCIDKVHVHFDNIIVIGDLNYDLVKPDKMPTFAYGMLYF